MKNKLDNKLLTDIKNILLKKAEGYFYDEEIFEYQNKVEDDKQLNFFDTKDNLEKTKQKNGKQSKKENTNLILTKKKVTTHHVPPDLLAVKMLVEIFGEKVNLQQDLYALSDEELFALKDEIINKFKE